MALLQFTRSGIYCSQGDFYIDPWRRVNKALITHGHSDHARPGSKQYLCTHLCKPIIQHRLGKSATVSTLQYGESTTINGVKCSFHPAGHVVGSAQVRVEYKGEVWVVSGDYKTQNDSISGQFELVRCHTFITESTFGLPVYQWRPQDEVIGEINEWWNQNSADGKASLISAYSLGKAQRLLQNVDHSIGPVYCHHTIDAMNNVIRASGVDLADARLLSDTTTWADLKGALILSPGVGGDAPWAKELKEVATASASGWMAIGKRRTWRPKDKGFVLSDHADWTGLNETIRQTGAEKVIVTHGYTKPFTKWLREQGYEAYAEETMFTGEAPPDNPSNTA